MKNFTLRYLAVSMFIMLFALSSFAQHDHSNHGGGHAMEAAQPPNGGVVKEAGKYKIEMLTDMFLKKDQLRFYLFKGNFKPVLNNGITGTITITHKDGKTSTQSLQAKGDDFFVAQLKNLASFQVIVEFTVKGKIVSTVFLQNGLGVTVAKTYSCSMHPEVESDSPGKCPKCGMTLTEQ